MGQANSAPSSSSSHQPADDGGQAQHGTQRLSQHRQAHHQQQREQEYQRQQQQQQQTTPTSRTGRHHILHSPRNVLSRDRNRGAVGGEGGVPTGAGTSSSSSNPGNNDASGKISASTSPTTATKPRRKSLDMPDMSLSMTNSPAHSLLPPGPAIIDSPGGTGSTSTSATATPVLSGSPQASKVIGGQYPYPGTVVRDGEGMPMAATPTQHAQEGSNTTSSSAATGPSTPATATGGTTSRWSSIRRSTRDPHGAPSPPAAMMGKKSQPVTGSTSALHASGNQIQPSTPGNKYINLPPVSTAAGSASASPSPLPTPLPDHQQGVAAGQRAGASSGTHGSGPLSTTANINTSNTPFDLHSLASPLSPTGSLPGAGSIASTIAGANYGTGASGSANPFPVPIPTPLKQPTETILAPELPSAVSITVPHLVAIDGAHDIVEPSSAAGGYLAMGVGGVPALAGVVLNEAGQVIAPSASAMPMTASSSSGTGAAAPAVGTPPAAFHSPLLPGSTPPLGNPPNTLPAAAPLAALNPELINNPKMQEVVQAATVDLGAGPDGVPTLLTWKAEEEDAIIGSPSKDGGVGSGPAGADTEGVDGASSAARTRKTSTSTGPQQVFVTGTFAKGWNTKIELRRKESDDHKQTNDFTALVKLPPGPHSLKFIVDKQWKHVKYSP